MSQVQSKTAMNTMGALYITIQFNVLEIKDRKFISDGHSAFDYNVKKNKQKLLDGAIYNAIKTEFPTRTITPYNIKILDYHYTYYLENYKIVKEEDKYYETYLDLKTKKTVKYLEKESLENKYYGETNQFDYVAPPPK